MGPQALPARRLPRPPGLHRRHHALLAGGAAAQPAGPASSNIRANYDLAQPCVFEGLRNPHDFVHLFDPRTDTVVLLEHLNNELRPTDFENGLDVIGQYARYLVETGLLPPERRIAYEFPELHEPAGVVAPGAGATAAERCATCRVSTRRFSISSPCSAHRRRRKAARRRS